TPHTTTTTPTLSPSPPLLVCGGGAGAPADRLRRTLSGRIGPALLLRQRLAALIPAVRFRSRGVTRQHG
ncbi:hypothetical protein ACWD7C_09630, partial [Streptomyces sp. NPDC005134]